jgi:penicillin-binding protein 1A
MKEVVQYGTAARANALGRPVAGKTGTNQDFRDGWFIGYSPRVVTGVWVGYDDQRSMGSGETGATTALPIWVRYMQQALRSDPVDDFEAPEGITFSMIDPKTGKASSRPNALREAFIAGTEPGVSTLQPTRIGDTGEVAPAGDTANTNTSPNAAPTAVPPASEEDEFLKEDR